MSAVLRFAPSPNGALHLGHALSALDGYDLARRIGGRFLVRIEDIDTVRCRPELIEAALEDLAWLGISWEEPVLRQSEHLPVYAAAADRLRDLGLLYPCFASRAEIEAAATSRQIGNDPDGAPLYSGLWPVLWKDAPAAEVARRMADGEPFAMRLDVARAVAIAIEQSGGNALTWHEIDADGRVQYITADPAAWGDAVIVRKDTPTSYHLSVVVDDARQGVTHVTRGHDLYAATSLHRLLQAHLGLPAPLYRHHRLITDAAGRKLSKSARDTSLRALRAAGWTPTDIRRAVGLPMDMT